VRKDIPMVAVCGTIASISFGASIVAIKMVIGNIDPVLLALYRFAIATSLLTFVAFRAELLAIHRADLMKVFGLGILFFGVYPWITNAGLQHIPASRGAMWLATMPFTTFALGYLLQSERPTRTKIIGISLATLGVMLALQGRATTFGGELGLSWEGDGLYFAGICCGSIYLVFVRPLLRTYSAVSVTYLSMVSGSVFLALTCAVQGELALGGLSPADWACVLFLGTFGGALGWFLWIVALQRSTPTQTAVFMTLNPMVATILSAVLLGETITLSFVAGLAAVIAGVIVANRPAPEARENIGRPLPVQLEAEMSR
jgi:drug/metabolite transporter (DMT)-like permease